MQILANFLAPLLGMHLKKFRTGTQNIINLYQTHAIRVATLPVTSFAADFGLNDLSQVIQFKFVSIKDIVE